MKVAWVHTNALRILVTGEDLAADDQARALERAGVDVRRVAATLRERGVERQAITVLLTGHNKEYVEAIRATEPDVIHVHKWYPWLGWRDVAGLGCPVVATVHNYRPLCPVGTLFRKGAVCTECVHRAPVPAVLHGCFDGSRLKSLPVALSRPYPAARHPLYRAVTLFVAPSRRAAGVLSQLADIDEDRIRVVPAFVEDVGVPPSRAPAGWLFVGQLEPTKGIEELVRHWPRKERLTIVGTGSLQADLLRAVQGSHIDVVGGRSRREVRRMMADSIGLVFPSAYLETQGLVVGEAASVGCPVVALTGTAGADQVTEHGFGVVLDSLEELDPALSAVATNRDALSSAAMTYWREELTEDVWVTRVQSIYSSLAVG